MMMDMRVKIAGVEWKNRLRQPPEPQNIWLLSVFARLEFMQLNLWISTVWATVTKGFVANVPWRLFIWRNATRRVAETMVV